jgi:hypothetical protein
MTMTVMVRFSIPRGMFARRKYDDDMGRSLRSTPASLELWGPAIAKVGPRSREHKRLARETLANHPGNKNKFSTSKKKEGLENRPIL